MKVKIKVWSDRKISAIKLVRLLTGWGLKESKDAVEAVLPYGGALVRGDLVIETSIPYDEAYRLASEEGVTIEKVRGVNSLAITDVDEYNMKITIKTDSISGELVINKRYALDNDIVNLFVGAIKSGNKD